MLLIYFGVGFIVNGELCLIYGFCFFGVYGDFLSLRFLSGDGWYVDFFFENGFVGGGGVMISDMYVFDGGVIFV